LDADGDTDTFQLGGKTFTIRVHDASENQVQIYSSDWANVTDGSKIDVFPYLETISGKDFRVAFTEDVKVLDDYPTGGAADSREITLTLPTGTVVVDNNAQADNLTITPTGGSATTLAFGAGANLNNDSIQVGTVYYNFLVEDGAAANAVDLTVAIDSNQAANTNEVAEADAGVLFTEEEDNSDSDNKNAIIVPTTATSTKADVDVGNIKFTNSEADEGLTFEDSDYTGAIDPFGSYLLKDGSDTDQDYALITYPEKQMYAEVYVSEIGATITPGIGGGGGQILPVKDADVSAVSDKNLIVVGGSCVNQVAATILGSPGDPLCGSDFTDVTNAGPSQYILKTVVSPYNEDKIAMLVAGYEKEQTLSAVALVKDGASTDIGEQVYPITASS
jgi:hypothetical protein